VTDRSLPSLPQPVPFGPVDPINAKEMAFAIQLFQSGLRVKIPMQNPENWGINVGDNDVAQMMIDSMLEGLGQRFVAREGRISPRDSEAHRAAFAVLDHCRTHPARQAIFIRTMAFYFLVSNCDPKALEKWQKPSEDEEQRQEGAVLLHPAVIEAAAIGNITPHGQFEPKEFFALVEKIAREKYPG
jgi:hypothetical protein